MISLAPAFLKSERAHAAAPPYQIESAAPGFDLGLRANLKLTPRTWAYHPTQKSPEALNMPPGFFMSLTCVFSASGPGPLCGIPVMSPPFHPPPPAGGAFLSGSCSTSIRPEWNSTEQGKGTASTPEWRRSPFSCLRLGVPGRSYRPFFIPFWACSLIFWKVSSLRSCSTLQASTAAVSSLTPRRTKNSVSRRCRS